LKAKLKKSQSLSLNDAWTRILKSISSHKNRDHVPLHTVPSWLIAFIYQYCPCLPLWVSPRYIWLVKLVSFLVFIYSAKFGINIGGPNNLLRGSIVNSTSLVLSFFLCLCACVSLSGSPFFTLSVCLFVYLTLNKCYLLLYLRLSLSLISVPLSF
jgi:hypothetical protein